MCCIPRFRGRKKVSMHSLYHYVSTMTINSMAKAYGWTFGQQVAQMKAFEQLKNSSVFLYK